MTTHELARALLELPDVLVVKNGHEPNEECYDEIKEAVSQGRPVHWATKAYRVVKDSLGQWLIVCTFNDYCIGLTWRDGVTVNGKPEEFFIGDLS